MIRFLQPWWLLAVLPVLAMAGAYVWRTLHRRSCRQNGSNGRGTPQPGPCSMRVDVLRRPRLRSLTSCQRARACAGVEPSSDETAVPLWRQSSLVGYG